MQDGWQARPDKLHAERQMEPDARKQLEAAGWKTGGVQEFLGLSDEEMAFIVLK